MPVASTTDRITNLKKKKTPGTSKINAKLLQPATPNIIQQIINTYNACISTEYFPKAFKETILVWIPKRERDTTNPSNYTPISLFWKILEGIINERLQRHLEDNELVNEIQFGFWKRKGYQEAIVLAFEFIS